MEEGDLRGGRGSVGQVREEGNPPRGGRRREGGAYTGQEEEGGRELVYRGVYPFGYHRGAGVSSLLFSSPFPPPFPSPNHPPL
jgi:hypothetical protein